RHRSFAGMHGRRAALRYMGAELRHTGIHAPHGRDRRRVSPRLYLCRRHAAPRRRARPWGGYRRATCVALSLPTRLFAREPAGARRHVVALVMPWLAA